jgi:hypothetical protein
MRTTRAQVCTVTVGVVIAATGLGGCGSGGDAPSDFCKSISELGAAVTKINQDPATKSTMPAVQASLKQIDSAVQNLAQSASPEFATEVDAVEADTKELDKSVAAATQSTGPATVEAVRESMRAVTTSTNDLSKGTSQSC